MSKIITLLMATILFNSSLMAGEQFSVKVNMPDNASGFILNKNVKHDELGLFYNFAIQEIKESNFGISRDMLECIIKKTDKFPLCHYHLGTIYSNVSSLKNPDKAKYNFEKFVSSKAVNLTDTSTTQQAYLNLIELEHDRVKLIKFSKQSLRIEKNELSLTSTLRAYQKIYADTNDEKYEQLADVYGKELELLHKNKQSQPETNGLTFKLTSIKNQ